MLHMGVLFEIAEIAHGKQESRKLLSTGLIGMLRCILDIYGYGQVLLVHWNKFRDRNGHDIIY